MQSYELGDDLNNLSKKVVKRPLSSEKIDYTVQLDDYKQEILIPISLQQFFKAWALQVSGLCKRTLVDNLDQAMHPLTDEDYEVMDQVAEMGFHTNPLTGQKIEPSQLKFDVLVYLPRIEGELQKGDTELLEAPKIIDMRAKPEINRLLHACKSRFKPIYDKLVMPVVRLSKLGYDYVGPKLDDVHDKLYNDPKIKRWLFLTKICESQGNYELVESEEAAAAFPVLEYEPVHNYQLNNELWIKGAEALGAEFARINGSKSRGFQKFLYDASVASRRAVAAVDPHQFAWYRRNQNSVSSMLNALSIMSNVFGLFHGG